MTHHPRHPNQLPGTKWSTTDDRFEYRHWEVDAVHSDGTATLRPSLQRSEAIRLAWRELCDREQWEPGWT